MKKTDSTTQPAISTLRMNNLKGRVMNVLGRVRSKEILLIYAPTMDIESVSHLANLLSRYGNVTVPDLPGFGGMSSFYKINEKPTVDNYAAYLAALVRLKYKKRRITIVTLGASFAFAVRMLQRYSNIESKTNGVISIGGYPHSQDLSVNIAERYAKIFGYSIVNSAVIGGPINAALKFNRIVLTSSEQELPPEYDFRTASFVSRALLNIDLCKQRTGIPLHYIPSKSFGTLKTHDLAQHLQVVFKKVNKHQGRTKKDIIESLKSKNGITKFMPSTVLQIL